MLPLMQVAQDLKELKVPKWPFFLGDAIMLGLAYYIYWQAGKLPLDRWELGALGICAGLGTLLGILPYLLEYRAVLKYGALVKLIETSSLCAASEKIAGLESCVAQIACVTDSLQTAQARADKTAGLAKEITDRMSAEAREFTAFLQKSNDSEKATLRLEAEKLRRAEAEWVGVLVHILDHVFALTRAAERSGQEKLISQLRQFENACRESARRVGLSPVVATPGENFDPQRYQSTEAKEIPNGATIGEVVASGYTFQGKLIRPVMVRVPDEKSSTTVPEQRKEGVEVASPQRELSLGSVQSPVT
jgi:molecular chaperone GrpE (heat shock protein)